MIFSVDPKLPQLKNCQRNKQKEGALEHFSSLFTKLTERFGLLLAEAKIVKPDELKKQVVDALHFGHPGSTKTLAESNIIWWTGMPKDVEEKCSTCTACMSFGKNLQYQF